MILKGRLEGQGWRPSPSRSGTRVLPWLVSALFIAVGFGVVEAQSPAGEARLVSDGVYTLEQAKRGEAVFVSTCAACHSTAEFSSSSFRAGIAGVRVFSFFEFVRTNMPWRDANTLLRQEYADVVAYIMSLNDFPVGEEELPLDVEELRSLTFPAPSIEP